MWCKICYKKEFLEMVNKKEVIKSIYDRYSVIKDKLKKRLVINFYQFFIVWMNLLYVKRMCEQKIE